MTQGDDSPGEDSASGAGYSQPRLVTAAGPYGPPAGGSGVGVSGHGGSGADEEQLVETICTPGGLRAQPDREHLRLFVEGASGASGQRIAQLLQAKIVRPLAPVFETLAPVFEKMVHVGKHRGWTLVFIFWQRFTHFRHAMLPLG